jgi:hypothetical protein
LLLIRREEHVVRILDGKRGREERVKEEGRKERVGDGGRRGQESKG